jgi:hypothetical protein
VVSHWLLTAKVWFNLRPVCVGLVVDRVAMGQVLLRLPSFSPVSIIPKIKTYLKN